MLGKIKQYFKKYNDMANAVDYLTKHMSYHLMSIYKISTRDDTFAMFGYNQLKFLIASRVNDLNSKQINKIINIALKNVITTTKAGFMATNRAIYIALR